MRVAIIGRTVAMLNTGKLLIERGIEVPLVITSKEAPEYNVTVKDFENLAAGIGAKFICTSKINSLEIIEEIKSLGKIDIACSINYTGIISADVLKLFELGILNSHAGDLPRYRGNAVLAWPILNKEDRIALCIHSMIGGELDSGPIISRIYKKININTKIKELYDWVFKETPELFLQSVEKLKNAPGYVLEIQSKDSSKALRCYPRLPEDGLINWSHSAENIVRLINASGDPFPGAFTYLENEQVIIVDAELYEDNEIFLGVPGQVCEKLNNGCVIVLTGNGKLKLNKVRNINSGAIIEPILLIKSTRQRFRNLPLY